MLVEWDGPNGGGNGGGASARLRSRSLHVDPDEELLIALRDILGPECVHLVKAS